MALDADEEEIAKQEKELRVHAQVEMEQLRLKLHEVMSEKDADTDSLCKAINALEQRLEEARAKHSKTLKEHAESEADLLEGLKTEAQRRKSAARRIPYFSLAVSWGPNGSAT